MSRDYGKVRSQFWDDDALRELSIEANYLALYLLTSRHTNAIGCFRLPIAYILNDTRLDAAALERALAELRQAGYALPCERVPWIYIPNFLRHNQPENPNVWRKCVKELEALLGGITAADTIASELIAMAGEERMSKEGSRNRISEEEIARVQRYRNGIETVSNRLTPLPCPSPKPIPEPIQNQSSAPAGADASKPTPLRATRWPAEQKVPPDWLPPVLERFRELGRAPPDLRLEAEKFANYWAGKSGKDATKLDWPKTFLNWCLNARTDQRSASERRFSNLKSGASGAAFVDGERGQGVEAQPSNLVRLALSGGSGK
jgi:hypothetical protein